MANNKMLIDASHPEETRVVVVRGNRIEEFDFEAQDRRQLRGNIYLAKVTRVEPSLQAAFIDYGGNRHGFLAFSEIHPDYYQIPAADRQALLEAEAEAAARDDDDHAVGIEEAVSGGEEDDGEEETNSGRKRSRKKSRRGGRGRKSRDVEASAADDSESDDSDDADSADSPTDFESEEGSSEPVDAQDETEEAPKPKKRTRRSRKPKAEKAAAEDQADADNGNDGDGGEADADDESGSSKTMAAMMDIDQISEDAPEDTDDSDDSAESAPEKAEKPKRKTTRRKPAAKKAKDADEEASGSDAGEDDQADDDTSADNYEDEATAKPKRKTARRKSAAKKSKEVEADEDSISSEDDDASDENASDDGADAESDDDVGDASPDAEEKPRKRSRNGRRRKTKAEDENDSDSENDENGDDDDAGNGKPVESVGQEDALEEVAVKRPRRQYKIQEVIRRRQVMLVQVVKEERGNKGAALTTYLSLAGRYSVLMPNTARGGGISRKITNPADRKRLKEIAGSLDVPKGMGVILRTAGASREKEEIERDFDYLMRLWGNVRELTLESSAPFLVYEEGSLIKRSIRDLYNKDIGEIIVSGEEGYKEAKEFMRMLMPGHGRNVKLYQGEQPLLAKFNVESQLDKMVTPQVTLKSGGYLIINQTEALVAIDVNSGRSTREHSIEATALQTNLEAAEEVARQLRLRDLAGLVVIDFIDMEEKRNNRAVERKLKECLKNDRARIQVGHISHFGLMEMSRQRIRASVLESTMAVCPTCQGVGHVRSEPSFGLHILRGIDDHLNRHSRNDVTVKVPASIAMYLLNNKRSAITELEDRYGVKITFESDHAIEGQEFTIEKGEPATRTPRKSLAVNPMPVDDTDDIQEGSSASEDAFGDNADEASDEDRESNRKGRRRRGRGRGKGRDRDENQADSGKDQGADTSSQEAKPEEESNSGENKSRESRDNKQSDKSDRKASTSDEKSSVDEGKNASTKKTEVVEEAEAPAEPRRRTGRPGKKVRTEAEAKKTEKAPEEKDSKPRNGAPPREVKRRNTRRVAKPKESEGEAGEQEPASWGGGFLS